jgi:N-acetylglucosaminyl-diphospho-decaprenol L-rhamnosyltransferase
LSTTLPTISVSIVSHLQAHLLYALLGDLDQYCETYPLEVVLTLNLPETLSFDVNGFDFPVIVQENQVPKGFAANHNQAFATSSGQFFCVLNPDVRLIDDPFPALLACLQSGGVGVVAPMVVDEQGRTEDSARRFPTPFKIICKVFGGCSGADYEMKGEIIYPDWVGGMFLLFPRAIFEKLTGFNQRFHLYYEDVDLCVRLKLQGYEVVLCPMVRVIHEARRDSHRKLKYLVWHLSSMMRYFCSSSFLKVSWLNWEKRYCDVGRKCK